MERSVLTMDELRYVDNLLKDDCVCACAAVTLFLHMHHIHAHWCATVVWCCSADTTIARIQYLCRQEVEALEAIGHKRLLLLTGEHPKYTFETFLDAVSVVRMHTCRCATQTSRSFLFPKIPTSRTLSAWRLQLQNTPVHTQPHPTPGGRRQVGAPLRGDPPHQRRDPLPLCLGHAAAQGHQVHRCARACVRACVRACLWPGVDAK